MQDQDTEPQASKPPLRLALPKGRMQEEVFRLLHQAGLPVRGGSRSYRPALDLPSLETKLLKPQKKKLTPFLSRWFPNVDSGFISVARKPKG